MNTERILLVDDSENDNLFHEITIRKTGFAGEIRAFESAELLLEDCGPQSAGCIVLDMRMPGMDGLQAQAELRRLGILMPVIFLTGHGDVPMSVRAMKAGAYDFLEKPVAADTLLARIRGAMKLDEYRWQKHSEREAARTRLEVQALQQELIALPSAPALPKDDQLLQVADSNRIALDLLASVPPTDAAYVRAHLGDPVDQRRANRADRRKHLVGGVGGSRVAPEYTADLLAMK